MDNVSTEYFVSVLERRRMMRKSEEEKEIDWKVSGKVDEEEMKSKVESLLSKLKVRFSEEREARKSIVKPNRSYYNFCNSVDAFLRHIEKPKTDIKYSEVNDDSQGEELYSFGVRPASIGNNRKVRSFETPVKDSGINTLTTKENDDEVIKKDMDCVESGKEKSVGKEVIVSHIDYVGNDTLFDKPSEIQASLGYSISSPDDKICPAIITDDTLLQHEADNNILEQDIFDNMLQRGSDDHILEQDIFDNMSLRGSDDNILEQDIFDNMSLRGSDDNILEQDIFDNMSLRGSDDNILEQDIFDNMSLRGSDDNILEQDIFDNMLQRGSDDNILEQDIFDNMLQRGSDDNIVLQGNDGCQFNPIANDMWTYENLNLLQCGKFSPCPRDMPMFFKEIYPQNMSTITKILPGIVRTNASIVPFTGTVPFTKRHLSICGINMTVPLKYLKKIVNDYAYQFLINAKPTSKKVYGFPADENLIGYLQPIQPIIHLLTFKDINNIISLITVMCPITKHYVLDIQNVCMKPSSKFITVGNLKPKQRHDFNISEKPTNKQLHGVSEHKISKVPQIFNLSLEDERVTKITTVAADDQNVFADDSQRTGNEKIIDVWDDVGSFGIMSIYCNSEIHSGYARVPADDTTGSIQLK